MRFHIGAVPDTPEFKPDASWRPVLAPGLWTLQLLAAPLGLLAAAAAGAAWAWLTPVKSMEFVSAAIWPLVRSIAHFTVGLVRFSAAPAFVMLFCALVFFPLILLGAACLALVHEFVHAVAHPGFGFSDRSVLGVWPAKGVPYAYYDGEISRTRYIAILLAPLLTISILPLLACALTGRASGWLAAVSALNALGSSGDLLAAGLLLFQVPRRARLRGKGGTDGGTYWRKGNAEDL